MEFLVIDGFTGKVYQTGNTEDEPNIINSFLKIGEE